MQVQRLRIDNHKCLVDFDIRFQPTEGGSSTILIGENGTGKSTFLGALLTILMSFDSGKVEKQINYNYELTYIHSGSLIKITQVDKTYQIEINDQIACKGKRKTVLKQLKDLNRNIFPSRVVYFYSGANDHALSILKSADSAFCAKSRKTIRNYRNSVIHGATFEEEFPRRKYIYSDEELVNIYALSVLCGPESFERRYLDEYSQLKRVDHIDFSILLSELSSLFSVDILDDNALLDSMWRFVEFADSRFIDAIDSVYMDTSRAYFTVPNPDALNIDTISLYNFFDKIHSMLSGKFQVYVAFHDEIVDCNDLSEGQRQLIKILGMLGVCKSEDCLVLMDEPDAHMNPRWKYDLKTTIDGSLQEAINTQALIATHDPLVINGVDKEFIRIFTRNQSILETNHLHVTQIIEPEEDTAGMGIDGLLQSEYYGLPTILDKKTKKKVNDKRNLLVKKVEGTITPIEQQKLNDLIEEIEDLTFTRNMPTDDLYDEYVAIVHKFYKNQPQVTLSAKDIEERNSKVEEILKELMDR